MLPDLADIYDTHSNALFAFLLNFTRSEADAHDVLQDVFLKIAERPSLLENVRELRGWLVKTCHRQALDAIRRRDSRTRAAEAAAKDVSLFAPAADPEDVSFQNAVALSMGALPEEQRAVVHLKIWEEMTFAQIAEALGIPPNTVASRYRYALDKLEGLLRPLENEPHP
jgi:RNA polymerase sigma-70 factor, ECF subfamily